jgi:hypothetical protein
MGAADQEPDPNRQVPTLLWWILGLLLAAAFAGAVVVLGPGHSPAVGPSAGSAIGAQPPSPTH